MTRSLGKRHGFFSCKVPSGIAALAPHDAPQYWIVVFMALTDADRQTARHRRQFKRWFWRRGKLKSHSSCLLHASKWMEDAFFYLFHSPWNIQLKMRMDEWGKCGARLNSFQARSTIEFTTRVCYWEVRHLKKKKQAADEAVVYICTHNNNNASTMPLNFDCLLHILAVA